MYEDIEVASRVPFGLFGAGLITHAAYLMVAMMGNQDWTLTASAQFGGSIVEWFIAILYILSLLSAAVIGFYFSTSIPLIVLAVMIPVGAIVIYSIAPLGIFALILTILLIIGAYVASIIFSGPILMGIATVASGLPVIIIGLLIGIVVLMGGTSLR